MHIGVAFSVALLLMNLLAGERAGGTRFLGTWAGVFHGGRGDQAITLVCRPSGADSLAGSLYMNGEEVGPVENGRVRGDSIQFQVLSYRFRGARDGDEIAFQLIVLHGPTHEFEVRFMSPDTTGPAPSSVRADREPASLPFETIPDAVVRAHVVPSGATSSTVPALRNGTLLLVGGGASQQDLNAEFSRLAGGPRAHIVVIPTASIESTGSDTVETSASSWARVLGIPHVTVLHATSRRAAEADSIVGLLRDASGVWLSGGESRRLLSTYLGTRTERELFAVLERGGVIGGTSAGALVWGSECLVFSPASGANTYYVGRPEDLRPGDPRRVCFGALRNVLISPHFTEFKLQASLEKWRAAEPGLLAFGIDEATALEVHGDRCTVLGRGAVTVYDGETHQGRAFTVLRRGARYDLGRRQVL
jgi:cyanophycinase